MAIYSGFYHEKWWFSIAMLVHQRVNHLNPGQLQWSSAAGRQTRLDHDTEGTPASLTNSHENRSSHLQTAETCWDMSQVSWHGLSLHTSQLGLSSSCIVGYGSIPINTIFRGMNIHKSKLFWCELQGYNGTRFWHTASWTMKHDLKLQMLATFHPKHLIHKNQKRAFECRVSYLYSMQFK